MKLKQQHLKLFKTINKRGLSSGCSDLEPREVSILSKEEWNEFSKEFSKWNSSHPDDEIQGVMPDFAIVDYINHLLIENYNNSVDLNLLKDAFFASQKDLEGEFINFRNNKEVDINSIESLVDRIEDLRFLEMSNSILHTLILKISKYIDEHKND